MPVMRTEKSKTGLKLLIDEINNRAEHGFCKPTKKSKILEIGAFAGDATFIFSQHFLNVVAIDAWKQNIGDITISKN